MFLSGQLRLGKRCVSLPAGDASGVSAGRAFLTVYQWMNDCVRAVFFLMVEFESQTGSAGGGVGSAPSGTPDRGRRKLAGFFAVVTETFCEKLRQLRSKPPTMYRKLKQF